MAEARKPLLIVEDDPALQKQMRWAFDGYETVVAVSTRSSRRSVLFSCRSVRCSCRLSCRSVR